MLSPDYLEVFLYAFFEAVVVPVPVEVVLGFPLPELSIILTATLGLTLGSFISYFIGSDIIRKVILWLGSYVPGFKELNENLENKYHGLFMEYGYLGFFIVIAIPGMPDTAAMYIFSMFEPKLKYFVSLVALGSIVRLTVAYLGLQGIISLFF